MEESTETKKTEQGSQVPEGRLRNGLIVGSLGIAAAIIFGLLYLFVIAPAAPAGGSGWSVGWFLFSFATGLTMIVLPCTLPLAFVIVPLSMGKGLLKGFSMAVAFGVGVAATLSLYGVAAALIGAFAIDSLGAPLEVVKNWVYFIAGIFALVFALSEIGLLNIHMPTYSGAAPAFIQKRQEVFKAFLLGLFLGNIGVGCPHPATPLLLIEIASSGDVLYGWLMFLTHALGRVLPLVLLAFLAILGVNGLNWLMTRKAYIERLTGWMMVFVAGFILTLGLFSHDWWVNSGLHTGLETLTQETYFTTLLNKNFSTDVQHVHGLESGTGLFGLPLGLGHWTLVFLWLLPIWWWWFKKRKTLYSHPSHKLKVLQEKIDTLERDRRQVESMVNLDEVEKDFDLSSRHKELDELEAERRKEEEAAHYGETGEFKEPAVAKYEVKMLKMHRNYLFVVSVFLALVFIHYMPTVFYLRATNPNLAHDHAHATAQSTDGAHVMADGTVMNGAGEVIVGAHQMADGSIMLADGSMLGPTRTAFSKSTDGLPDATGPLFVELNDGDTYNITAAYVKKEVGNRMLRMLAYNGSIPGPFIKAKQGSTVTVNFKNDTDVDQTIHSHGLRLDNRSDGVPNVTQDPVRPGESFTYTLTFPDAGIAWYHPHTRDDYGQEMGLYGNYLVDPLEADYWSPVNREVPLVLDDVLIENDAIANFYEETVDHALLGRFGNTYLVNGETDYLLNAKAGEVIRFLVTNVSNARTYRLSIPGADMKIVGAEWGRYEQEVYKDDFVISPAERMVVEAYFPKPGLYKLVHTMPDKEVTLANFAVSEDKASPSYVSAFNVARRNTDIVSEFDAYRNEFQNKEPDKSALLTVTLTGMVDHSAHMHNATTPAVDESMPHDHSATGQSVPMAAMMHLGGIDGIQWDDPTNSDKVNSLDNVEWKIVDQKTGKVSMDIDDWVFKTGQLVKIRFTNDASAAHVMQHPIHFHGQRFLVLSENGVPNQNMAWKDTALVLPGEYIDILVEMSNPGEWMSHCHISEHLHAGMMLQFRVEDESGNAPGDEYRATVQQGMSHMGTSNDTGNTTDAMQSAPSTEPMQMMDPDAPAPLQYSYSDSVSDSQYYVSPNTRFADAGKDEIVVLTFSDAAGNAMTLDESLPRALSVTFVSSDNSVRFVTYPGNTVFPNVSDFNVPGSANFDESLPHSHGMDNTHSFLGISKAYAHGGVDDGHVVATGGRTYSIPVRFPTKGNYRGFVEFTLAGESSPRIASFDMEVGTGFSVNNFGWTASQKWWTLLIISLLLMVPLVLGVRKYINNTKV